MRNTISLDVYFFLNNECSAMHILFLCLSSCPSSSFFFKTSKHLRTSGRKSRAINTLSEKALPRFFRDLWIAWMHWNNFPKFKTGINGIYELQRTTTSKRKMKRRWWAVQRQEWCLANLLMLAFNWSNLQFFSSASALSQETNCEFSEVFFGNTVFAARLGLWWEETDARITVCLELPQRYRLSQNDTLQARLGFFLFLDHFFIRQFIFFVYMIFF